MRDMTENIINKVHLDQINRIDRLTALLILSMEINLSLVYPLFKRCFLFREGVLQLGKIMNAVLRSNFTDHLIKLLLVREIYCRILNSMIDNNF